MESPAGAHSASPAELQAPAGGRAKRASRSCSGEIAAGQRILTLEPPAPSASRSGAGEEVDARGWAVDEEVSRLHAEIERIGGEWTVSDDGLSRNGSFVNGERVAGRRRLADRDELRFGSTMVLFRSPRRRAGRGDGRRAGGRRRWPS